MSDANAIWKLEPGELPEDMLAFAEMECRRHAELYAKHRDTVHLWRAWRCARACGSVSPKALEYLTPHLDTLASIELKVRNPMRANQRDDRNWILLDYYHELMLWKEPRTPPLKKIRERVAKRHNTTQGRVEQLVLEYEGRDGRSPTSRSSKPASN